MSTRDPSPFSSLLLRFRATAHMTQERLAALAGLSPDAIAALERGKRRTPRATTVRMLADALQLTDDERSELFAASLAQQPEVTEPGDPSWDAKAHGTDISSQRTPKGLLAAIYPTPLVDRDTELIEIYNRLGPEGVRLLTVTGPGGVGKTRIAMAAAAHIASEWSDRFAGGVVAVDLTSVRDPDALLASIARGFGLNDTGATPLRDRLTSYVQGRDILLVLDNFEHLLSAAASVADLLSTCPRLVILVTSRAPLRLLWEQTLRISPLPVPDLDALPPLDALARIPSVRLFVERAQARRSSFRLTEAQAPLVANLVAQLDGLPLALELAAAPLDVVPLATMVRRLDDRMRLLRWARPDVPERQHSLTAAANWSYELLNEDERRIFRHLGVFVSRATVEAVAAVVSVRPQPVNVSPTPVARLAPKETCARQDSAILEGLVSLAEKSLVLPGWLQKDSDQLADEEHDRAFGMLETVREFAWEQLAKQGELDSASRAHAHYFLDLAEQADPRLRGPDQRVWYLRLEYEHDNLRAALRWLFDQVTPEEREASTRLAMALGWFWAIRGYPVEGWRWLQLALARTSTPPADGDAWLAVRFKLLLGGGSNLVLQGKFAQARTLHEEALDLAYRLDQSAAIANSVTNLGIGAAYAGEWEESVQLLREARRRWEAIDDNFYLGLTLHFLGSAMLGQGNLAEAERLKVAALEHLDASGSLGFAGGAHLTLAALTSQHGDLPHATSHVRAGIDASVALRDRRLLSSSTRAVLSLSTTFDPEQRARLLGASDVLSQTTRGVVLAIPEPAHRAVSLLREQIERGAWATAYHEGRSLAFSEVVSLAYELLDEVTRSLPSVAPTRARHSVRPAWKAGQLSEREHDVLHLVAQGLSSKAIGQQLSIATSTVNQHLTAIFNKLGVSTRAQAVAVAAQRRLL